ncbi:MAG TPA: exodeoxyribonuclease VII large subunit [Methanospirillum sp.]|uniref:exodeoxyribonuclease VII large subunit n=1 Tax=Methanospirillum sp. TaxID=45200 RepID=UPI002CE4D87A|nr:exodeoxyribonuclease VII large subunit [Methanospirillum sp.]HWQ63367.1 exodeoxyribonuclease VII large subunit [Methanospirillum sp.]
MDQLTLDSWGTSPKPAVMRVSEVTAVITSLLDTPELTNIRVTGEITNFKKHGSGHLYFSLSERQGEKEFVIRCTIWKTAARYLPWKPEDGMIVEAFGSINHYERGGQYNLIVTQMWQSGAGEKALLIERWKKELGLKGYFSPERKRSLPDYPTRIGVVTSETGAVIHDIQNVLSCRFPVEIILSPTAVQGPTAHDEIAAAIRRVAPMVDLVIVGRGGGSYEDLFAFNNPTVVEAIATCPIPVIAAIGHEVDVTLADLAADVRASTPSHAAEIAVRDRKTELEMISQIRSRIFRRLLTRIEQADEELNDLRDRLSPVRMNRTLSERRQYLVDITDRMSNLSDLSLGRFRVQVREMSARLEARNPSGILMREIPERRIRIADLNEQLCRGAGTFLARYRAELESLSKILEARSPYASARDGYCIVFKDGKTVGSAGVLSEGEMVELRFRDGSASAVIDQVNPYEEV